MAGASCSASPATRRRWSQGSPSSSAASTPAHCRASWCAPDRWVTHCRRRSRCAAESAAPPSALFAQNRAPHHWPADGAFLGLQPGQLRPDRSHALGGELWNRQPGIGPPQALKHCLDAVDIVVGTIVDDGLSQVDCNNRRLIRITKAANESSVWAVIIIKPNDITSTGEDKE